MTTTIIATEIACPVRPYYFLGINRESIQALDLPEFLKVFDICMCRFVAMDIDREGEIDLIEEFRTVSVKGVCEESIRHLVQSLGMLDADVDSTEWRIISIAEQRPINPEYLARRWRIESTWEDEF